jgi:hypothetical protein
MSQLKPIRALLLPIVLLCSMAAWGQGTKTGAPAAGQPPAQPPQPAPTIAATIDREITAVEKLIVDAAEAMPEDKFGFSPEGLNLPGADYKGVRTFAQQVKHVAASNYAIWSPLTSDKIPEDFRGGNGPVKRAVQGRHHEVSAGFLRPGPPRRGDLDGAEFLAERAEQPIAPPVPGHVRSGPRLRSLRPDGRVPADERDRAARQPGKIRLTPGPAGRRSSPALRPSAQARRSGPALRPGAQARPSGPALTPGARSRSALPRRDCLRRGSSPRSPR